jgi:tetratricopeptide (TPR) repeat protein
MCHVTVRGRIRRPAYPETPSSPGEHLKKARLDRGLRQQRVPIYFLVRPSNTETMNKTELRNWTKELRALSDAGKPAEAIAVARAMLRAHRSDINVRAVAASSLIDAGTELGDLQSIQEGIGLIEELLEGPHVDPLWTTTQQYNLSNGYASQYKILYDQNDHQNAFEARQKHKLLLQALLLQSAHVSANLLPWVHTNYANVLDELDRTIEAIDYYSTALDRDPQHMLAKGNCGEALHRFVLMSRNHWLENLDAAVRFLDAACAAPDEILKRAGHSAVASLQTRNEQLRAFAEKRVKGGLQALEAWRPHRDREHGQPPSPSWLSRIVRDRLLLTFNQFPLYSENEAVDDLFFTKLGFGLDEKAKHWSVTLIFLLNVIKEEFVTARHLYYQAVAPSEREQEAASITSYADPAEYAEFGLEAGLLKTSLRTAVDLLDKVVIFINLYLKLGHDERAVNFNVVWFTKCTPSKREHPTITALRASNRWVAVLRDLCDDWFNKLYPGPLKDLRNVIAHRGLVLFSEEIGKQATSTRSVQDLANETLLMLRTAKAAIGYLKTPA